MKKLTSLTRNVFVYASVRLFVDGMEEFLIQPTAWYYVRYIGQSNVYLGFLLSAFSIGALVFAPCFGAMDTKFKTSKIILLVCGAVKFLGNLLYTIPANSYFPLVGRLMSGIGEGTIGVIYGAVAQATNDNNRAQAFLYFEGLYMIGTAIGPVLGSALIFKLNFLGLEINPGNSPGLILTLLWLLLLVLTMFLPNDLTKNSSRVLESVDSWSSDDESTPISSLSDTANYSYSRICCVSFVIFQSEFILSVGLFYTPLLAVDFGLGLLEIKLIYVNSALLSFFLFVASYAFSSYVSEKTFIVIGIISNVVPLCLLFFFALTWDHRVFNETYLLFILTLFLTISFVLFPLASSLLSKETPVNMSAFYQSIAFTLVHSAIGISRVLAGATFNKTAMKYVAGVFAINWFVELTWFLKEYRHLHPAADGKKQ